MNKEVLEQPVLLQCLLVTATTRHVKFPRRATPVNKLEKMQQDFCLCIVTTDLVTKDRKSFSAVRFSELLESASHCLLE